MRSFACRQPLWARGKPTDQARTPPTALEVVWCAGRQLVRAAAFPPVEEQLLLERDECRAAARSRVEARNPEPIDKDKSGLTFKVDGVECSFYLQFHTEERMAAGRDVGGCADDAEMAAAAVESGGAAAAWEPEGRRDPCVRVSGRVSEGGGERWAARGRAARAWCAVRRSLDARAMGSCGGACGHASARAECTRVRRQTRR